MHSLNTYKDGKAFNFVQTFIHTPKSITCSHYPSLTQRLVPLISQYVGDYNMGTIYSFLNCYSSEPEKYYDDLVSNEILESYNGTPIDGSLSLDLMKLSVYKTDGEVNELLDNINTQLKNVKTTHELSQWVKYMSGTSLINVRKMYNISSFNNRNIVTLSRKKNKVVNINQNANTNIIRKISNLVFGGKKTDMLEESGKFMTTAGGIIFTSLKEDIQITTGVRPIDIVWRVIRDKLNNISFEFNTRKSQTEFYTRKIVNELSDFVIDIQAFANVAFIIMALNMTAIYAGLYLCISAYNYSSAKLIHMDMNIDDTQRPLKIIATSTRATRRNNTKKSA